MPDQRMEHGLSDFYSAENPVPNVQGFEQTQSREEKEAQEEQREKAVEDQDSEDEEEKGSRSREVFDPITKRDVIITDRGGRKTILDKVKVTVPKEGIQPPQQQEKTGSEEMAIGNEDLKRKAEERGNGFVDVPRVGVETNVLYFPFPAPEWDIYHSSVRQLVMEFGVGLVIVSWLVHFCHLGWKGGIVAALLMGIGVYNLDKKLVASWHDVKFDVERQRGRSVTPYQCPV